jgi:hypothetical protein
MSLLSHQWSDVQHFLSNLICFACFNRMRKVSATVALLSYHLGANATFSASTCCLSLFLATNFHHLLVSENMALEIPPHHCFEPDPE